MQYKYYPFRLLQKLNLLQLFNSQVHSLYAGKKFRIPIHNGIGVSNLYTTEVWMKELIKTILQIKDGIFIDVGANIGQTLMKLRSISSIRYIGIEPNPDCIVYLQRLIHLNQIQDCTICPVGLNKISGLLVLYGNSRAATGASIIKDFREDLQKYQSHTHTISVMPGDDLIDTLASNEKISIIKVDVEGAELEVLQGMTRALSIQRPFVLCEILPVYSLDTENGRFRKERQDRLLSFLKFYNYSVFRIKKNSKFEFLSEIEVHGKMELSEYVFVPFEMKESFDSITQ